MGAVIPVIVNDICAVDVMLFIFITFELIVVHDHEVQLRVLIVKELATVTSM